MPQSPFQQSHQNPTATAQHLPVYQHSPYTVHTLPPHGYATTGDHSVLYPQTIHHPHSGGRWVSTMETEDDMLNKYRQEDTEADYEMDHQSHDHPQQQHLQPMQAPPPASHESQSHPTLQPHPPMTSLPSQPEQMSPAARPGVVRTGALFLQKFPNRNFCNCNYRN